MEATAVRTRQLERSFVCVVAVLVFVLALYWQTSYSMVKTWRDSGTYSHGFLIVPVFLWLVWDRRRVLSRLTMRPSWVGLFGLGALGLLWLIGDLLSANAPAQFAVVAMVPAAVATVLGMSWVRALAFPLAFLFFAVPFGDALVPYLTDWTADFTVVALKLSGVPIHREGNNFSIPSGDWSVIEGCSGIRYVFACLSVATLYAWTFYRSTARRLVFVVGALLVAIVANWLRAFLTVLVAHLSGNRWGTGFDHIVFAEVLYGAILLLVFWLGTRWTEDRAAQVADWPNRVGAAVTSPWSRVLAASLVAVALLSIGPLLSLATRTAAQAISGEAIHIESRAGWERLDEPGADWAPQLSGPQLVHLQTFAKSGHLVSVFIGLFAGSTPDSKVSSSANQLVGSRDSQWREIEHGSAQVDRRGEVVSVKTAALVGRGTRVTAWHWYWVDGTPTGSAARAAMLQLLARLGGRSALSAWVTVFTANDQATVPDPVVLDSFVTDMLDSIDQALRGAADASGVAAKSPLR